MAHARTAHSVRPPPPSTAPSCCQGCKPAASVIMSCPGASESPAQPSAAAASPLCLSAASPLCLSAGLELAGGGGCPASRSPVHPTLAAPGAPLAMGSQPGATRGGQGLLQAQGRSRRETLEAFTLL